MHKNSPQELFGPEGSKFLPPQTPGKPVQPFVETGALISSTITPAEVRQARGGFGLRPQFVNTLLARLSRPDSSHSAELDPRDLDHLL